MPPGLEDRPLEGLAVSAGPRAQGHDAVLGGRRLTRALEVFLQPGDLDRGRGRLLALLSRLIGHPRVVKRGEHQDVLRLGDHAARHRVGLHRDHAVEQPRVGACEAVGQPAAVAVADEVDGPGAARIDLGHQRLEEPDVVDVLRRRRRSSRSRSTTPCRPPGRPAPACRRRRRGQLVPGDLVAGGGVDPGQHDDDRRRLRQLRRRRDDLVAPGHAAHLHRVRRRRRLALDRADDVRARERRDRERRDERRGQHDEAAHHRVERAAPPSRSFPRRPLAPGEQQAERGPPRRRGDHPGDRRR